MLKPSSTPPAEGAGSGRDVVLALGFVTWADGEPEGGVASAIVARHLVRALLEDDRIGRVLVANPFRSAPVQLLKRRRRTLRTDFPRDQEALLYQPLRLRRRDPCVLSRAEGAYGLYDRRLHHACARAGLERPVTITTSPLVAGLAPLEWAGAVTYYARDDYGAARAFGHARYRGLYQASYGRIRARARAVAAVSHTILEQIAPAGAAAVVPNGIDPGMWRSLGAAPAALAALPAPRLLYVGRLDERLNVPVLRAVAARFSRGSVALVGPVLAREHLAGLAGCPNVHVLDAVPRGRLAGMVASADVGLIPHVDSRETRAMSPLKVYEYLAGGLPVAASDLPGVEGLGGRVVVAGAPGQFPGAVERALALGRATEAERLAFVEANSWQSRHRRLIDFALAA